jgi:hypothetical protein
MYQIKVRIDTQGRAEIKAEGYQGPGCATVTQPFIDALGLRVSDTPTEEMFQTNTQQQEAQA